MRRGRPKTFIFSNESGRLLVAHYVPMPPNGRIDDIVCRVCVPKNTSMSHIATQTQHGMFGVDRKTVVYQCHDCFTLWAVQMIVDSE